MPMPRRPTQMARTCIIARSRAALLRAACAIERAAVGAVDDGDRAARIAIAMKGSANEIRLDGARRIIEGAMPLVDGLDIGGIAVAGPPPPGHAAQDAVEIIIGRTGSASSRERVSQ